MDEAQMLLCKSNGGGQEKKNGKIPGLCSVGLKSPVCICVLSESGRDEPGAGYGADCSVSERRTGCRRLEKLYDGYDDRPGRRGIFPGKLYDG